MPDVVQQLGDDAGQARAHTVHQLALARWVDAQVYLQIAPKRLARVPALAPVDVQAWRIVGISVIGEGETKLGQTRAVRPTVKGAAGLLGMARWTIDRDDPVGAGFLVS